MHHTHSYYISIGINFGFFYGIIHLYIIIQDYSNNFNTIQIHPVYEKNLYYKINSEKEWVPSKHYVNPSRIRIKKLEEEFYLQIIYFQTRLFTVRPYGKKLYCTTLIEENSDWLRGLALVSRSYQCLSTISNRLKKFWNVLYLIRRCFLLNLNNIEKKNCSATKPK